MRNRSQKEQPVKNTIRKIEDRPGLEVYYVILNRTALLRHDKGKLFLVGQYLQHAHDTFNSRNLNLKVAHYAAMTPDLNSKL